MIDTDEPGGRARRPRMAAHEREAMIIAGAIRIVSRDGFDISVRDLASRLDVPHSVLFRHFPTKAALLKRIYDEVFVSRLRPEWSVLLADGAMPLATRLLTFYRAYTTAIFDDQWVRIFLFAGLKGTSLNKDYFALLKAQILEPICLAVRCEAGTVLNEAPLSAEEIEKAWGLHGRIFHIGIRRHVYRRAPPDPIDDLLTDAIAAFLGDTGRWQTTTATDRPLPASTLTEPPPTSRRMNADARARSIVEGAVAFFARRGMSGQMRELARNLGVTHSLLLHYFPCKQELIEQVYAKVFDQPWHATDQLLLLDQGRPLGARLLIFYRKYLAVIDRDEWIRIFISAGLHDAGLCGRYLDRLETQVIDVVAEESRRAVGAASAHGFREAAWGLHGQIVYTAIRHHIYAMPATVPPATVEAAVSSFLADLERKRRSARETDNGRSAKPL